MKSKILLIGLLLVLINCVNGSKNKNANLVEVNEKLKQENKELEQAIEKMLNDDLTIKGLDCTVHDGCKGCDQSKKIGQTDWQNLWTKQSCEVDNGICKFKGDECRADVIDKNVNLENINKNLKQLNANLEQGNKVLTQEIRVNTHVIDKNVNLEKMEENANLENKNANLENLHKNLKQRNNVLKQLFTDLINVKIVDTNKNLKQHVIDKNVNLEKQNKNLRKTKKELLETNKELRRIKKRKEDIDKAEKIADDKAADDESNTKNTSVSNNNENYQNRILNQDLADNPSTFLFKYWKLYIRYGLILYAVISIVSTIFPNFIIQAFIIWIMTLIYLKNSNK